MTLTIDIDNKSETRFIELSGLIGEKPELFLRQAILEKLEELEDIYDAKQRLKNPGHRFSMEEVEKELGLEN